MRRRQRRCAIPCSRPPFATSRLQDVGGGGDGGGGGSGSSSSSSEDGGGGGGGGADYAATGAQLALHSVPQLADDYEDRADEVCVSVCVCVYV